MSRVRKFFSIPFVLCCLATSLWANDAAERAYRAAQQAEHAGDHVTAYLLYAEAAQADPRNPVYSGKMAAMNGALHPRTEVGPDPANETLPAVLEAEGLISDDSLFAPPASPPPHLALSGENHSFTLKGSARDIFDKVAGACAIRLLYEPDYKDSPPINLALTDVACQDALRALEAATDSFVVPLNDTTAMVARDTPQTRAQLTPVVAIAVPIPQRITLQEAQELATAVQQTLEIRRISLDASRRAVFFRDSAAKVYAARKMFTDLSRLRAQIVVDVQFLSMSKTSSLAYGLHLPTSAQIVDFGALTTSAALAVLQNANMGLLSLGGGLTRFAIGVGNSTVIATLSRANTMSLLESRLVSLDGQAVTFRVGDRYPVITSSYSGVSGANSNAGGTIPAINYVDLGLGLKVTPQVHEVGEISLDIEAEFKSISGAGVNGIPIIANQQYQGKVRLKTDEWAVVAGLLNVTQINDSTGIAGLSGIPILGDLFRTQTHEDDRSEILLILKPRVVALPPWEEDPAQPIWTGTETRPVTLF